MESLKNSNNEDNVVVELAPSREAIKLDGILSYAQRSIYKNTKLHRGLNSINNCRYYSLLGNLNKLALVKAVKAVVIRHECLRSNFIDENGELQVMQNNASEALFDFKDITHLSENSKDTEVKAVAVSETKRQFDLSKDLLVHAVLLKLSESKHIFFLTVHPIVSDNKSLDIFISELSSLYQSYLNDTNNVLTPLSVSYKDYLQSQNSWLEGKQAHEQLQYWQQQLKDLPLVHSLSLDHPRSNKQRFTEGLRFGSVDEVVTKSVMSFCVEQNVTLLTFLHAVFVVLIHRYSNEGDIAIGTSVLGRNSNNTEALVGLFSQWLVLRSKLNHQDSFIEHLMLGKQTISDALGFQHIPFELLIKQFTAGQNTEHHPLFQIAISLQDQPPEKLVLNELEVNPIGQTYNNSGLDLELRVTQIEDQLLLAWNYNKDLFKSSTIERLSSSFQVLLEGILLDADRAVGELPLLSADQQQQLRLWNATDQMLPGEQGIHELFELQASNSPDAIAVVMGDDQLSYQQLNEQANQLAGYLLDQGVRAEDRIGVCMHRSPQLLVALLGILKSGAAYVPLDPEYPSERLIYMLSDSKASYVLIDAAEDLLSGSDAQKINISDLDLSSYSDTGPLVQVQGDQLGYVIYTSGSTGQPKGVCIRHGGALGMLSWALQEFGRENLEGVLASTSICFDLSVYELFAPLSVGGKVVLAKDALSLLDFDQWDQVSLVNTVPSAIEALVGARDIPRNVRVVNLAGEALSAQTVEKVYASSSIDRLYNLYGPSEDTTYSTGALIERGSDYPSIGGPISNSQVYVLDSRMSQVPVGVTGELYMGGLGLSRGYLDRGMLTAERFVPNPYGQPGSRMYRTGDLVRYRADGDLEYVGRIDHQVKLRGFRIELGEIESALEHHAGVESGLVQVVDSDLGQQLVGYITTDQPLEEAKLKQSLQQVLPSYMVPMAIVQLESFPLTANGKVDRERLPSPDWEAYRQSYVAPRNAVELQLAEIYQELLSVDRVGINDNFFELGGHSLLATHLISRIREGLDIQLPLKTLFDQPTVAGLSPLLENYSKTTALLPIEPAENNERLLSYAQRWLWFVDKLEGDSTQYNIPVAFRLTGKLEVAALVRSLQTVAQRHEVLRSNFQQTGELVYQHTLEHANPKLIQTDLSEISVEQQSKQVQQIIIDEAHKSFDLAAEIPIRLQLVRLSPNEHALLVTIHHIATDGLSMDVFYSELQALYTAYARGLDNPLPPLAIQYSDYAQWQRDWLGADLKHDLLAYWKQRLAGIEQDNSLPLDRPRPGHINHFGLIHQQNIDDVLSNKIKAQCVKHNSTLFMLMQTVFSILLYRYTSKSDVLMGTTMAGRAHVDTNPLIGFFANTVVLRTQINSDSSFSELLSRNKVNILDAQANQYLPFEMLVEALAPERSLSHSPIIQIMFTMVEGDGVDLLLPGLNVEKISKQDNTLNYDLRLSVNETDGLINLDWVYNPDIFDTTTIERMAANFSCILNNVINNPESSLKDIPFLCNQENNQLLQWAGTAADAAENKTINELFEAQVIKTPRATALVFDQQHLTYEDLNNQANRLAHYLIEQGVGPETMVGLCVMPSLEMVIGMLGIIKAGGAYVPLDPVNPEQRLAYILNDSGVNIVLSQNQLIEQLPITKQLLLSLDAEEVQQQLKDYSPENPSIVEVGVKPNNLAYMIYTSGTTGQPKGVMAEHRNLSHFHTIFIDQLQQIGIPDDSPWLWSTSFVFDPSIKGLLALNHGRTVVIATQAQRNDTAELTTLLLDNQVQVFNGTPSLVEQVMDHVQSVSDAGVHLIIGGEEVSAALWEKVSDYCANRNCRAINVYGPTELTINASYALIDAAAPISIGKPVFNSKAYVLGKERELLPVGAPGELYVAGDGVVRGYWKRQDLTMDRFVPNSFSDQAGERLYRTGDRVRWLANGDLEFLGRADDQVKVRGFRIELGEIEAQLAQQPHVHHAHVLIRASEIGEKQLAAYLVLTAQDKESALQAIKANIKQRLPGYMLPTAWLVVDEIPLTPIGKVDRIALSNLSEVNQNQRTAPISDTEKKLCEIWKATLEIDQVGVEDDFFDLGGYSLLAMKLINLVRQELNAELDLQDIFEHPDIASMARVLEEKTKPVLQPIMPIEREGKLQASNAQQRLWFIDKLLGDSKQYNITAAFKLSGKINKAALKQAAAEVVNRHEILRCNFSEEQGAVNVIIKVENAELFESVDLSSDDENQKIDKTKALIHSEAGKAFNLSTDSLLRVRLASLSDSEHALIITVHHIVADGWSMGVLYQELSTLYAAYDQKKPVPLPPLAIQYIDFAVWQNNWLQRSTLDEQLGYWKQQLAGIPTVHDVPLDYPRTENSNTIGAIHRQFIDEPLNLKLEALCSQHDVTLFMLMETAFAIMLSRYSGKSDIVIGTPVSGRIHADIEPLIGFFANAIALRSQINKEDNFLTILRQNKEVILDAYKHQSIQFETLVEALQQGRTLHYNPIIQIMFTMLNEPQDELSFPGIDITKIHSETDGLTNFDLRVLAIKDGERTRFDWIYNTDIFDSKTIARMAENFCYLFESIVSDPTQPVKNISLLSEIEKNQLLNEWSQGGVKAPDYARFHELFEAQVARTPNATALVIDQQELSFQKLNEKSNQLANYLIEKGIKPDTLVGLYMTPSLEMVIGILGIIKAGGAYVPLDTTNPAQRLQYMLEDAGVEILVTQDELAGQLSAVVKQTLCLDAAETQKNLEKYSADNPSAESLGLTTHHLLYVIYTSGSTGQPKGVQVAHRNLCNFQTIFEQQMDYLGVADDSPWLWNAAYVFDASLKSIAALNMGKCVVIATQAQRSDVNQLGALLLEQNIPVFNGMPQLVERVLDYLQTHSDSGVHLIASGDQLNQKLWDKIAAYCEQKACQAINAYGPTELTVNASYTGILPAVRSNIGKPTCNSTVYILDEQQNLLPIGAVGELYVGGLGLARGYLNQPALTEQNFISNPFTSQPDDRLYKTGDRVRWLVDGQLEFLGRTDDQVKIHGFRIELGEIETCLIQQAAVKQAKVLVRKSESGEKQLVAYLVLDKDDSGQAGQSVQDAVKYILPDYMLPTKWLYLDAFPLLSNGKVDKQALLALANEQSDQEGYLAPTTELEQKLCEIWQTTLEVEQVGLEDDFFDLGGYSLLAMVLINSLREELGADIDLQDVFEHPNVASMAQMLESKSDTSLPPIQSITNNDKPHLSYAQQRIWFIDQLENGSSQYNMPFAFRLEGRLNIEALQKALNTILQRHHVLRTHFIQTDDELFQVVDDQSSVKLEHIDLSAQADNQKSAKIQQIVSEEALKPFVLANENKLRAKLAKLAENEYALMLNIHHIASDGWSIGLLFNELEELYEAYCSDRPSQLTALNIQYADFAQWQRDWLSGDVLREQLNYWCEQLDDIPQVHNLKLDFPRPAEQTFNGKTHYQELEPAFITKLNRLAQSHDVTLFMLLESVFAVLVSRYSADEDVVIGSPIAGRPHKDTEELMGYFVNTLALRSTLDGEAGFDDFLATNKQTILDAYKYQYVPFEMLVDELKPERSLQYSPVFQVLFLMQNHGERSLDLQGLHAERIQREQTIIKFDLELLAVSSEDKLTLRWDYNVDIFKLSTIRRLADSYQVLLEAVVDNIQTPINQLPIVSASEQTVFADWNNTDIELPASVSVVDLFEKHVVSNPQAIAVAMGNETLSYKQLNKGANQLAHYLLSQGICVEQRIGVCMQRSPQLLTAMLGIMKSGAAYVPLDPEYPQERLAYMAENAGLKYLLTDDVSMTQVPGVPTLHMDALKNELAQNSSDNPERHLDRNNLAYVIYTSGSTGKPKGVANTHQGLLNLASWHIKEHEVGPADRGSLLASIGFDASIWEIWPYLGAGASLWCVTDTERSDPEILLTGLADYQVTHSFMPTPLAERLHDSTWPENCSLRTLLVGGDKLSGYCLPENGNVKLVNHYGPTETAVVGTFGLVDPDTSEAPSIGGPVANMRAYVLDQNLQMLPVGVTGELCLSGLSLARGYLDNPDLTSSAFMPDPYSSDPGSRLYRTGDMARYSEDGSIAFAGRADAQVKLRGFRIELSEIEHCLEQQADVESALVQVQEGGLGRQLVAYVVSDQNLNEQSLRDSMAAILPAYMVPLSIMTLDCWPLSANGKVDRKALPAPDWTAYRQQYIQPRNAVEQVLTGIFTDLLPVTQVGIDDNFFELGGDSIISIQLVSRARQSGLHLSVRDVFTHQTVRSLAAVAEQSQMTDAQQGAVSGKVALTPIQSWFVEADYVNAHHWNQARLFRLPGNVDQGLLSLLLTGLVNHHDALRLYYPDQSWSKQSLGDPIDDLPIRIEDLSKLDDPDTAMLQACNEVQASLNLQKGCVLAACLFLMPDSTARLLLAIHHMGVDGVSWRILQEDLRTGYQQLVSGSRLSLPAKSHSYQAWSEHLHEQAQTAEQLYELEYWQTQVDRVEPLYVEQDGSNRVADSKSQSVSLDKAQTEQLLKQVNHAYRTQIDDVLLTALLLSYREWTGSDRLSVHLEGHGREVVGEELDITRTVGWFTSIYPVTLSHADGVELGQSLMGVKEQLRSIPNKGIGYGLLRYLHADEQVRGSLKPGCPVEMSFNYLGQFQEQQDDELFTSADEAVGESVSRDQQSNHKISLVGRIRKGRLHLNCNYSDKCYSDSKIESLLSSYVDQLEGLIAHCTQAGVVGRTPSDYPLCQLNQSQLDELRSWQGDESGEAIESIYPLSPVQQGMLFHSQAEQGAGHYVVQMVFELHNLDASAYRGAWEQLLASHGVLRTVFWDLEGEHPQQVIPSVSELPWVEEDWSQLNDEQRDNRWRVLLDEDRTQGFASDQSPLMRCYLIDEGNNRHRFLWSYHHALLDGWSMPLVMRDLSALYRAQRSDERFSLKPEAQFVDYISWLLDQNQQLARDFWQGHLEGVQAPTPLVFGEGVVGQGIVRQTRLRAKLTVEQSEQLQAFAQQQHLTLSTLLQSMWGLLLSRYSGETEVIFGTTVSGRPAQLASVDEIVGPFISTLPVRLSVNETQSVLHYLEQFQQLQLEREQYGHLPLLDIQQCSEIASGVPLFETLVAYENYPTTQLTEQQQPDDRLALQVISRRSEEQTHYPVTLMMAMYQERLHIGLSYDADRFDEMVMERFLGHYQQLLSELVNIAGQSLNQLNLLTSQERQSLLEWNATSIDLPDVQGVHELFERQAELTPDATAVAMGSNSLSYVQLDQAANRLAHYLRARGVGSGDYVGVCMDRSIELMVSFMGILKSGATYVPMDPGYPRKRLSYMLEDTGISLLITTGQLDVVNELVDETVEVVRLDQVAQTVAAAPSDKPEADSDLRNLAYVIYTSGSTGEPKGVEVQHSGVINFLSSMHSQLGFDNTDRFLGIGPISFDTHVLEFYLPLMCGAQLIICDSTTSKDGAALGKAVWDLDISVLQATPATWQLITAHSDARFRPGLKAMAGGESFGPELADRVLTLADSFWNVYGPTEMTVYSSWKSLERGSELITVGRPIDNARIYLLDRGLELLPVGVVGEICISGKGMVRGYLNKPGLTASSYMPNPFSDEPGQRLYRTGDLGRFTPEGEIEYVGRIDHQVKVRGFRIELGEVESRLQEQPGIHEALAHVVENDQGQQLVGYVLCDGPFCESTLKSALQQTLPAHMVPVAILQMQEFPLTVNGKVNRKALPEPDWEAYRKEYVAPRNETEQRLAEIYQSLLSIDQIGIDDNFFELGGHSLLATQLINKVRQQLNVELPLRMLFKNPEIRSLVHVLEQYQGKETMPTITKAQTALVDVEEEWEGEQF